MDERLKQCLAPVADSLVEFEAAFRETIGGASGLEEAIADHIAAGKGKRMRPALVLLSHRSVSPNGAPAIKAAVAIELIHTATLLHDDVIDVSEKRRGRLSVNARWNNLAAVLMGDNLFARAFCVLVELHNDEVMATVAAATRRVAIGELLQLQHTRNYDLRESEYLSIIADKTASLFGASCQAGRLNGGGNPVEAKNFQQFGETLGMSFQIADDLLDYTGDTEKTGKSTGNDIMEGKITLPLIHALRSADKTPRAEIMRLVESYQPENFAPLCELIAEQGGFDYSHQKADQLRARALESLDGVPDSPYRRSLELLVDYSINRNV